MLTLTDTARIAIESILESAPVPDTGGLRIVTLTADPVEFSLSIAEAPEDGETVVAQAGARVFLDEAAAGALDDKLLDAQPSQTGAVQFRIGEQS